MSTAVLDNLYGQVVNLLSIEGPFCQDVYNTIEDIELALQKEFGFSQDKEKHKYKHMYAFSKAWAGRVFKCLDTGATITIPDSVYETQFFGVGNGFVDVGRWDRSNCEILYCRFGGNIEEVICD